MANSIQLPKDWVCTGSELKPKSGAILANTWVLAGNVIRPKSGAKLSNAPVA
jgi:hypothetical protein